MEEDGRKVNFSPAQVKIPGKRQSERKIVKDNRQYLPGSKPKWHQDP